VRVRWTATIASMLGALVVACTAAAEGGHFQYERAVIPGGSGPNRLRLDVPLLVDAQPLRYASRAGTPPAFLGGLGDVRLYDASGREVGYLLIAPPVPAERWQDGSILPIQATEEESGFEVDLRGAARIDRLRLGGIPAPFLKRARIQGSGDRNHWSVLVGSTTLFDLPDERLTHLEIGFAPGEFQYLRVTWDDRNSAPVALPARVAARVVTSDAAPAVVSVPGMPIFLAEGMMALPPPRASRKGVPSLGCRIAPACSSSPPVPTMAPLP